MTVDEKYSKWAQSVKDFECSMHEDIDMKAALDKYYRGTQILFSPLQDSPTFMFVGINPGAGFYNESGNNVKRFSPLNNFEYLHHNYSLARETRKVFKISGLEEELINAVKTNCFFFSTHNQADLHKLLSHLKHKKVYPVSRKWTNDLIDIINPKIIIAEGNYAFEILLQDKDADKKDFSGVNYAYHNNRHYIGYKRIMSFIKNKNELSHLIKTTYTSL